MPLTAMLVQSRSSVVLCRGTFVVTVRPMGVPCRGEEREKAIATLAAAQGGSISRLQLICLGLPAKAIDARVRDGRLYVIHRGVYAVGHPHLGRAGRLHAALLATGPGSALSHRTGASLWEMRPTLRARVEVTAIRGGRSGDARLHVHRVRALDPRDITVHEGFTVTTPARTLLDLAEVLPRPALDRAIEQALIVRRFDAAAVADVLRRSRGRRGLAALRAATADLLDTPPDLRSGLERRFRELCRRHGLTLPLTNTPVAGVRVDAHWPQARLVVELDGREIHGTPQAFERDRRRDRALAVAGQRVVRVTDDQMKTEATALAADLVRLGAPREAA